MVAQKILLRQDRHRVACVRLVREAQGAQIVDAKNVISVRWV